MIKAILKYVIYYTFALAVTGMVFMFAARDVTRVYETSDINMLIEGENPEMAAISTQGGVFVTGRYMTGRNAGYNYVKYFDGEGLFVGGSEFHTDGASIEVTQIVATEGGAKLVTVVTPRDTDKPSYGAVYTVSDKGKVTERRAYEAADESGSQIDGFAGGIDRFVCADDEGTMFAATNAQYALIYNESGEVVQRIVSNMTAFITDVHAIDENSVLIAGSASDSNAARNFTGAFYALWEQEGGEQWRYFVFNDENTVSAVTGIERVSTGWLLYGRSVSDVEEGLLPVERYDKWLIYDKPMNIRFHDGEGEDAEALSSAFMIVVDDSGVLVSDAFFDVTRNSAVPSLIYGNRQYSADRVRTLYTVASYEAATVGADNYTLHLSQLSSELRQLSEASVAVLGDTSVICVDDGKLGLFVYVSLQGTDEFNMIHYESIDDFKSEFDAMRRGRPIYDGYEIFKNDMPMIICVLGATFLSAIGGEAAIMRRAKRRSRSAKHGSNR